MQGGSRVKLFQTLPQSSQVIISVALMLFLGFAMTRLTKKLRLPNVTAYILCGIIIGPYCLDLVPQTVIDGMDFLSDIALAFIAFSVGEFFRFSTLKKTGGKAATVSYTHLDVYKRQGQLRGRRCDDLRSLSQAAVSAV